MNSIKTDINILYELSIKSTTKYDLIIWKKEDINEWFNEIFTIYVTGIADWCDGTKPSNLMIVWNRVFRNHILSLVPARFKHIHIIHHDILESLIDGKLQIRPSEERVIISNFINDYIIKEDNKIPKVVSVFNNSYLPLDRLEKRIPSYILLDLAHAFEYTEKIGYMKLDDKEYKINRLHERYYGDDIEGIKYYKYFHVNEDNTVVSYYDKLIESGLPCGIDDLIPIPSFNIDSIKLEKHIIKNLREYKMYQDETETIQNTLDSLNYLVTNIYLYKLQTSFDDINKKIWNSIWDGTAKSIEKNIDASLKAKLTAPIIAEIDEDINKTLQKLKK